MKETVKITLEVAPDQVNRALELLEANSLPWTELKRRRQHKTDPKTAELIYGLYKSGVAVRDISRRTKVSRSTVSKIARAPSDYGLNRKPLQRQGVAEDRQ